MLSGTRIADSIFVRGLIKPPHRLLGRAAPPGIDGWAASQSESSEIAWKTKYVFFPPWNGSSSSYWIQKMLRMNLVADNSSQVTIV